MNRLFYLFFFLLISCSALPRFARQTYYSQNTWGYQPQYSRGAGLWRYGGVGGPSGEGSTWEASAAGIHANDLSIFG